MFTGLVECKGIIRARESRPPGVRLVVVPEVALRGLRLGDSIAVSGCCLTVVDIVGDMLGFDMGEETLQRTKLGQLQVGDAVNLERSLMVGDRLGGHFVSGHIDTVGSLTARHDSQDWSTCWFEVPARWTRLMAEKGSVAVDGVSLTLVEVQADRFSVMLIPHTLSITTLGQLTVGDPVQIETDLLAKYVARQLTGTEPHAPQRN